jgi:hypothetical protein
VLALAGSVAWAYGWSDAFGPVPLLLNAGRSFRTHGQGERNSAVMSDAGAVVEGGYWVRTGQTDAEWVCP